MKKLLTLLVAVILFTSLPYLTNAQTQSPGAKDDPAMQDKGAERDGPDPGGPGGGGAPIGGGLFILLGLGAAYGSKKVYSLVKE